MSIEEEKNQEIQGLCSPKGSINKKMRMLYIVKEGEYK